MSTLKRRPSLQASPDRLGSVRYASTQTSLTILKVALAFGGVLMACLAFTALYVGPMRLTDEFSMLSRRGCLELDGISPSDSDGFLSVEAPLQLQVAELEEALAHARAVAVAAKPQPTIVLDRVAILGERNSGTNPVEHILRSNLRLEQIAIQAGLRMIKHYFQPYDDSTTRTLILIVVRNPYDWLDSMHRSCYCCEEVHEKSLEDFLKSPFQTTATDPVTGDGRPTAGCPLDLNTYRPPGSQEFDNVMKARYEKFQHWMNFSRAAAGYEIVQAEQLMDPESQKEWFMSLADKYKLPVRAEKFDPLVNDARFWRMEGEEGYFTPEKRIAQSIYMNPALLPSDAAARVGCRLKNNYFDAFVEDMMGYSMLDCDAKPLEIEENRKEEGGGEEGSAVTAASG